MVEQEFPTHPEQLVSSLYGFSGVRVTQSLVFMYFVPFPLIIVCSALIGEIFMASDYLFDIFKTFLQRSLFYFFYFHLSKISHKK